MRHPHIRDVCDIGQHLFWDSKIAWYFTAVMFLLNNTFIQVPSPRHIRLDRLTLFRACTA
jgi:hypothetical protein